MTIEVNEVGNLNQYQNVQQSKIAFRANEAQSDIEQKPDTFEKQGMSTGKKVAIGATIMAGLAVLADVIFAKGKHIKALIPGLGKDTKVVQQHNKFRLETAVEKLKNEPIGTEFEPAGQTFKNCKITYKKIADGRIDKIVTRKDGTVVTGHYWCNEHGNNLGGATILTERGRVSYNYDAMNYDKIITIDNLKGSKESFTRLGHKDNPKRFTDTYINSKGKAAHGDYSTELNRLYSYVIGK